MVMDIKPYCLIISFAILIMMRERLIVTKFFSRLIFISFAGLLLLSLQVMYASLCNGIWDSSSLFMAIRKYGNYISLLVIGIAGFNVLLYQGGPDEIFIKRMILLWLASGIAELFFPSLMQVFTPGARTSLNRGVTGLSMEPSFYGYMCFFFMIMSTKFQTQRFTYCVLCIFQIVFLARSTVGVLYLFVFAAVYTAFAASPRRKITFAIASVVVFAIVVAIANRSDIVKNSRIWLLFMNVIESPNIIESVQGIAETDASVSARIVSITFSVGDFFRDMGMPNGFMYSGRLMSGYGAMMYELGIIGLAAVIIITSRLLKAFGIQAAVAILIVMFSAVQLASPTFIFLVSVAEYVSFREKNRGRFLDKTLPLQ